MSTTTIGAILAMGIFYGGLAQVIAGLLDFRALALHFHVLFGKLARLRGQLTAGGEHRRRRRPDG